MSFKINYGNATLGDVAISDGAAQNFNSYAAVSNINQNTITIINELEGRFEKFHAGTEICILVSSTNRETADLLGKYLFAKIMLRNNDVLTLDVDAETFFSGVDLDFEYIQVITLPNFDCLKVEKDATLTPPVFNPFTNVGGVLIVRCFNDFILNGTIDLTECGIPTNRKTALRPLHAQETAAKGETDKANLSGQENFITAERFLLNAGDGAVMIFAKRIIFSDSARIGNPKTHGVQFSRGAADSLVKPSGVTNIGGSTILIAADTLENFNPKVIAKYRSAELPAGKGLCRCFIASNSELTNDEALYSKDILEDFNRVQNLGVVNFGDFSFGDLANPTLPLNNAARVISATQNGYRLTLTNKTFGGLATIKQGALVLIQATQNKKTENAGLFTVARILTVSGDSIIVDRPAPVVSLDDYFLQVIAIPQFKTLTINTNFNYVKKFNDGVGGILAVAAETLDLRDGKLNVEGKGGAALYGRNIGNSQMFNRLPIGAGAGSVFILAKNLLLNDNSRIGSTFSGLGEGGKLGGSNPTLTNPGGGYLGNPDEDGTGAGGGYIHGGSFGGLGGSGFSRGTNSLNFDFSKIPTDNLNLNGAHVFIIADKIEGFTLAAISTGGAGAAGASDGSASYGGGGNSTSSGGNGGLCFIFSNFK